VIAEQRLRELAALRPDGHKVLSLYLNLDPSEFPTPRARQAEIDSLLDSVEKELRVDGLTHSQKEELKRDLRAIRDWYGSDFDAKGARGMAVFAAAGINLFEVHKLSRPIANEAVIDDSPFIEPLTTLPGDDGYCVFLVNRGVARILTGGSAGMREQSAIVADLRKWQGEGVQDKYQRAIAKEAQDHIKHAADQLFGMFKRGQVNRLIVGSQSDIKNEVEHSLHSYLKERIAGWIDIDVKAPPAEVTERAKEVILADEKQRESEWLDRLQSELGRQAKATSGLEDTLAALRERRVEALLLREGFRSGNSPGDEDAVEQALESALEQSAEIVVIRHERDRLDSLGSIAAVLRF
jgi:peptide chain release factor subunit 1